MSELINTGDGRRGLRWQLLASVSSLALLATVGGISNVAAEDNDRPTVWIELGANLERVQDGQKSFAPAFIANNPGSTAFDPVSPAEAQQPPRFSFGGEGKLSFEPRDSNWVFSASIRYGRANGNRLIHQTAKNEAVYNYAYFSGPNGTRVAPNPPRNYVPVTANFLAVQEKQSESHAVIDFQAGKDFGLGLFGHNGTSVLNAGVRFAQFTSGMQVNMQARPDLAFPAVYFPNPYNPYLHGVHHSRHYHQYIATARTARSFRGIGPSLAWNASAPFVGNSGDGELSVDWGANAAILFGRQKANIQHHTSAAYWAASKYPGPGTSYNHPQVNLQRARTIMVPNFGGFAGLTFSFPNVKVSAGYRGDFFFGAMDTGFDTAKKSTIGFYGPFASVSIGIGG